MKQKAKILAAVMTLTLALDQIAKYGLMGKDRVLIPGILDLTTAYNKGAAMSMFSGKSTLLLVVTSVIIALGIFLTLRYARGSFPLVCASCVLGGALGNWLDRLLWGYVIDLFEFTFIDFYVFNVADVFITVGTVLCGISIFFFGERDWGMKA